MLPDPRLNVPDQLLPSSRLLLSLRLLHRVRSRLLLRLDLRLLKERLELGADERRVLRVLVHREVLQALLDRGDATLRRERREERAHHVAGRGGRDVRG